ncbi:hypothetical protein V5O48_016590 [Marasmius crinis-equi]|uniref:F-box domain-containing protein n=1 Tax=Marasmius crinis-equi TaxID=585013 RepID=A0ABR3ERB0_9AGAR
MSVEQLREIAAQKLSTAQGHAKSELPQRIASIFTNTSQCVSSAEAASLSQMVHNMNDEAAHLRKTVALLADRVILLEQQSSLCSSLLSPIRRLPPEILGQILIFAAEKNVFSKPARSCWDSSRLSAVSSLWRDVALETAEVWSRLVVEFPVDPNYSSSLLQAVETHLERSRGAATLYYELCVDHSLRTYVGPAFAHSREIIRTLFTQAARISSICLAVSCMYSWGLLGSISGAFMDGLRSSGPAEHAPCLASLHLVELLVPEEEEEEEGLSPDDSREDVVWDFFPQSEFPCLQITTLHFDPIAAAALIQAFTFFPNVVDLDIGLSAPRRTENTEIRLLPGETYIILRRLESLTMRNISLGTNNCLEQASHVFNRLDAPKLRRLAISRNSFMNHRQELPPSSTTTSRLVDSIAALLTRSKPLLLGYSCLGVAFSPSDIPRLLNALPSSLEELAIEDNSVVRGRRILTDQALNMLRCQSEGSSTSPSLFPRLCSLNLSLLDDNVWNPLVAMIRSRVTNSGTLKFCRLHMKVRTKAKRKEVLKIRKEAPELDIDLVPGLDSY